MGATLSSRTQWTSASSKGGILNFSTGDGQLLSEISRFIDDLCKFHSLEASLVFKTPFKWKSKTSWPQFNSLCNDRNYVAK